ncbi:MAG: hypothetical protein O3A87_03815 [Verrucomicrobia bacterium]|nr:hypothetical protein [Verrucomicrobiota bacterium]
MRSILLLATAALLSSASAAPWTDHYTLEDIALPPDVPPEVGGLSFDTEGTLYVCLRRGDVLRAKPVADPKAFAWSHFASGFHNGCGIDSPAPGRVVISQMPELSEAIDTDHDGLADTYNRLGDGWGLSGNYHETNALCSDGKGGYYLAIGTASLNGPTFLHTRDEYSKFGRRGRNFSSVKYRGWVLHYAADGARTPIASGFRMHNGIYQDPDGHLWCGDNQGDWKATTPLYLVEKGHFYGHPSSLVWDEKWPADQDPLLTYRNDLDAYNKHRTRAAVQIPHMEMNRSAAEPMEFPRDGSFSKAFAGQLLLPDNNGTRITRIMLDEVNGQLQGSCTHFVDGNGLRSGNNRLRFSPDGKSLYVGQTVRGWGKVAEGLQRITTKDRDPFDLSAIHLTKTGFQLTFTEDLPKDAIKAEHFQTNSFTYQSTWAYGGPMNDKKKHQITALKQPTPNSVELTIPDLAPGRIYRLDLSNFKSTAGTDLHNHLFFYTANQLPN